MAFEAVVGAGETRRRRAENGGFWLARFLSIRPQPGSAAWFLAVRFWGVDRAVSGGVFETPPVSLRTFALPTIEPDRGGQVLLSSAVLMNRTSAWAGQAARSCSMAKIAVPDDRGVTCRAPTG